MEEGVPPVVFVAALGMGLAGFAAEVVEGAGEVASVAEVGLS